MTVFATLGGTQVGAWQPRGWTFRSGVTPSSWVFEMGAEAALALFASGGSGGPGQSSLGQQGQGHAGAETTFDVTLYIEPTGRAPLVIEQLTIMALVPTTHRQSLGVMVADRRWRWPFKHVSRRFNMRTKTGRRRRAGVKNLEQAGAVGTPIEVLPVIDDLDYFEYSLLEESEQPWTAAGMIAAVFSDVGQPWRLAEGVSLDRDLPVIDVEIDAAGHTAIQQALSYVPGLYVWLDDDGTAVVDDRNAGTERAWLETMGAPVFDTRTLVVQDHRRRRPKSVVPLFSPEIELRYTYVEDLGTETGLVTVVGDGGKEADPLALECVVVVPDATLAIPAGFGREARTVVQGTLVALEEYIAAINASPTPAQAALGFVFSLEIIRQTWMIPGFVQSLLTLNNRVPDTVLSARYSAIRDAFRSLYQMQPRTRHLLHSWNIKRAAIMDVETGNRSAGQVYSDWCQQFSILGRSVDPNGMELFANHDGSAAFLRDAKLAPAIVGVEDDQLGLLRVRFVRDLYGITGEVYPGHMVGKFNVDAKPIADPRLERYGQPGSRPELGSLASGYQCDVVVSVIPAVPNDIRRLVPVPMGPDDVREVLGRDVGPCEGPVMQVRVSPSVDTARYAWEDDKRDQYVEALQAKKLPPLGKLINTKVLTEYARALAASIYAQWVDRVEGQLTIPWHPEARPRGNAIQVTIQVEPDSGEGDAAAATTQILVPPEVAGIDPLALMNEDQRAVLIREVIRE